MPSIAENLANVSDRIASAARRSGRAPSTVRLIAVSKSHPASAVSEAFAAGQREFGENRVQEALAKQPDSPPGAVWHLIGHLQSNKARLVPPAFHMVHSVDSARLAEALSRNVPSNASPLPVLMQANLSGEATKSGIQDLAEMEALAKAVTALPRLTLAGLMTIPNLEFSERETRNAFARLRNLLEHLRTTCGLGPDFRELSMGMSHDYEWAIEEGATLVRVGTAIFGPRQNV